MTRRRVHLLLVPVVSVLLLAGCGGAGETRSSSPSAVSPGGASDEQQQRQSGLTAGSVDDNAGFIEYLDYRATFSGDVHDVDVKERRIITVVDQNKRPLPGALVKAGDQVALTYADGRAMILGQSGPITVSYGDAEVQAAEEGRTTLPVLRPDGRTKLQVKFLIDTTGSMGDEIDRLKDTVDTVAQRISQLADLELSMTLYRDRGDDYVTQSTDFTADVNAFRAELAEVSAGGGGDTPEDLNAGLHEALATQSWRQDAVKLVFLIADAPPHLDYQDGPDYAVDARDAARRAIKIMPIASSGLDDQGEYIYRQLAQLTMGRFTFLTYGADGASPGGDTSHHVSEYAVLSLDDLVVRLVQDELKHLAA